MKKVESEDFLRVAVLFGVMFVLWGGGPNASAVFLLPLIAEFSWSRTRVSALISIGAIAAGISAPLVGRMLARTDFLRWTMFAGAIATGACYLLLSTSRVFVTFALINVVLGASLTASTFLPCSLAVSRFLGTNRGMTMGIVFSGAPIGGAILTPLIQKVVTVAGWRHAYVLLGCSSCLLALPIWSLLGEPATSPATNNRSAKSDHEATFRNGFSDSNVWLIGAIRFFGSAVGGGLSVHLITLLTGAGYSPEVAATLLGSSFALNTIGSLIGGVLSDRVRVPKLLAWMYLFNAIAVFGLLYPTSTVSVLFYCAGSGIISGAFAALVPMLILYSCSEREFALVMGMTGAASTAGYALGPLLAGAAFDATRSYGSAVFTFGVFCILASGTALLCERRGKDVPRESTSIRRA